MRWEKPIQSPTRAAFRCFSMGHGGGRGRDQGAAAGRDTNQTERSWESRRRGVPLPAPTSTARSGFIGPETSMSVQAALRGRTSRSCSDECHAVSRPHAITTARSMERTHRWLERCLRWHDEHGPTEHGRLRDRAGRSRPRAASRVERGRSPPASCGRESRSADRFGREKAQDARGGRLDDRRARAHGAPTGPRHLPRESGRSTT